MSGPAAIVDVELTADEREILDALRVAGAYSSDANVIRSALAALARHLLPTIWLPGEIFAQRASRRDLTAGADCARDRGASREKGTRRLCHMTDTEPQCRSVIVSGSSSSSKRCT